MPEMIRDLEAQGADVDVLYPDETCVDVADIPIIHDLYVLKSSTAVGVNYAGLIHAAGGATLNPYPVLQKMKDKVIASHVLAAARIASPRTWIASRVESLGEALASGPIVVKPIWGSQGRGVTIVESEADLAAIEPGEGLLFAQSYHKPDGRDHKIYAIGSNAFGVRRVWPAKTYEDKLGEPFEVDGDMLDITRRCARAFGTDLFGLDIVYSDGKPFVVDINTFPGFKGVPHAAALLAEYIFEAAARAMRGEAVVSLSY